MKVIHLLTLAILGICIGIVIDSELEKKRIKALLDAKLLEGLNMEAELEQARFALSRSKKKQTDHLEEIRMLKHTVADLEKMKTVAKTHEQATMQLEARAQKSDDHLQDFRIELSGAKAEHQPLVAITSGEFRNQQNQKITERNEARKPKCPNDIDEFKDYLGYNLANIGVPTNEDYYVLLKDYLSCILFQGRPVIISRGVGFNLIKCVSNTLIKTPVFPVLEFAPDITEHEITDFLSQERRIVCLDNFIGNYNETKLLTICDKHRDKIIFLTVTYDRTLTYVPQELLKYCNYLNLDRIVAFSGDINLTEAPTAIEEGDVLHTTITSDARWSTVLKEILGELGISDTLSMYKSSTVTDEMHMCKLLAFDVLPYCVDVLKISPFHTSQRLVKYAGESGRCMYKDLFRRWFAK